MALIKTQEIGQDTQLAEPLQVYNGLDSMVTHEVFSAISALPQAQHNAIYAFERALQAPALEMMLRGFRVDELERRKACELLKIQLAQLQSILDRFCIEVWGKPLNPRSPKQVGDFFYGAMKLPPQYKFAKGERRLSTDREALELLQMYFHAQPVILCILGLRDLGKQLSVLESEVDDDGRIRQSYNIAGTETGRASSSSSATGSGTNLFNLDPDLRRIFISDPGYKIASIDFEQSEARDIGWLCWLILGDSTYLDHCESADLHTATARLCWPKLPWTKDKKANRLIAEQPYYRHFSYRDLAKRGGHACNYLVSAETMARHLKIELSIARQFQTSYFSAFSAIPRLHRWVAEMLQTKQCLTSIFGRRRDFFGRPDDEATLREAVAYCGQSPTADRTSLVMWRCWKHLPSIQLLNEVYDCVMFQYPEHMEAEVLPQALALTRVPFQHRGRNFVVPVDCKIGWNWGAHSAGNPNGLVKWSPGKPDARVRQEGLERML